MLAVFPGNIQKLRCVLILFMRQYGRIQESVQAVSDSYTNFIAVSNGGGYDGSYGNYGGSGIGPTSYNPYGTGSPGQSTYVGTGTAALNNSSVTNPSTERVTNNTALTVTNKAGNHIIASGTPAQLIPQADAIISVVAHDNQYYVDTYRAPVMNVPNLAGGRIDFDGNTQTFKDYLNRSMTYTCRP